MVTNRTGILQKDRRKIIQYYGYADWVDEEGGHGTHVAGRSCLIPSNYLLPYNIHI